MHAADPVAMHPASRTQGSMAHPDNTRAPIAEDCNLANDTLLDLDLFRKI